MLVKEYGKEPFDLHLCVLWFFGKIWILLLAGVIGGILFGGVYYLKNITFGPEKMYEMVSDSYLEYATNEAGEEYLYFNQTTWGNMIHSDEIMNPLLLQFNMTRKEMESLISATLLSDTRILTTTVIGADKEWVEDLNKALLIAIEEFGKNKREFIKIQPMLVPEEATIQKADIRIWNATVLGISIGFIATFFLLAFFFIWDDRIYITSIFETRYQIPMLGNYGSKLCYENTKTMLDKKDNFVYLVLDKNIVFNKDSIKEISDSFTLINNPFWDTKEMEKLEKEKKYILLVSAKRHNSKLIEATLQLIDKNECFVMAAILLESNRRLQNMYYFPGLKWIKKHLK